MADIFFSYSAKDRERVRPVCEALTALGFDVFWDQKVPAGTDWDTWIKEQLLDSRAAVVFWSFSSIASDNVRHEATVAKQQGKLVPVMLDQLRVEQFPMGLFNTQAARLTDWSGDNNDPEWRNLVAEIESKTMPAWIGRRIANLEAALKAETRRREIAESNEDAAEGQLAQELGRQGQLRREREHALAEAEAARSELVGLQAKFAALQAELEELRASPAATTRGVGNANAGMAEPRAPSASEVRPNATSRVDAVTADHDPPARRIQSGRQIGGLLRSGPLTPMLAVGAIAAVAVAVVVFWAQPQNRQTGASPERQEIRETQTPPAPRWRRMQNTALWGTIIQSNRNQSNANACEALCRATTGCIAFEFQTNASPPNCSLYSTVTDHATVVGVVSGFRD